MPRLCLRRTCLLVVAACAALVVPVASGQQTAAPPTPTPQERSSPSASPLAFDVVSVKPDKSGRPMSVSDPADGDGITMHSAPLTWILNLAYDIQSSDLISGVPDWTKSERYEIQAKVAAADVEAYHKLSDIQRFEMLQGLLAEWFKMKTHREPRDISIYALVIAKNGSKLKQVEPGTLRSTGIMKGDGTAVQGQILFSRRPGQIIAQEVPMELFAKSLSGLAGRQVIDKTGLTGAYDLTLEWDQNLGPNRKSSGGEPAPMPEDTAGPSIFAALEEQLGLKLESQKVAMPVLVIDHIEKPSEN
jgi:uncharacterized protein (TIGR03435 family)